jgi:hypothetical protein
VQAFFDLTGTWPFANNVMTLLTCDECLITSDRGWGWRAFYIAPDLEEDEPSEVTIYCPACAEVEFGQSLDQRGRPG